MTDWYYEDDGAQRGPIAEADLNTMLFNRLLPPDTKVWTQAFGAAWKPASQTQLHRAPSAGPPPLGGSQMPPEIAPSFGRGAMPPESIGHGISNSAVVGAAPSTVARALIWERLIAFLPLASLAADLAIIAGGQIDPLDSPVSTGIRFWLFVFSLWFASKDWEAVYAAGLNPARRSMVWFMFLTPIGYFLRRRAIAGTPLAAMWFWVSCVFLHLITLASVLP